MSATWRVHLDAVTARFPHEELHGAASEEVFAKEISDSFKAEGCATD